MSLSAATKSPEHLRELTRGGHVVGLANLMLEACRFDGLDCAAGLVTIAQVLAGKEPAAKTRLAQIMIDAARELDAHVLSAPPHLQ